jgi:uroporphyrinogen-III synthase
VSGEILILRPRPGAEATAERALELGLIPIVAPLFTIRPLPWQVPDPARFDALLLTSANAARQAGRGLTSLLGLTAYTVGGASAAAAVEAGLRDVRTGPSDASALLRLMEGEGVRSALHLCGREHGLPAGSSVGVTAIPVYAAEAVDRLPAEAEAAIAADAVALLHSPRAAALFSSLVGAGRPRLRIAAISDSAAASAGPGWAAVTVASEPRDQALLEAAAKLCHRSG